MRVSDSQIFELSTQSVDAARVRQERLSREALEQRKVFTPSDDPVAAAAAQKENAKLERNEGAERSINAGVAALQLADNALSSYGDLIVKMKELAIQHANETYDPLNRDAAAAEVLRMREAMVDLANTEIRGRYLFGGYQTDTPPFDDAGRYSGDSGVQQYEVAGGVRLAAGVPGDEVFGTAAGGIDLFQSVRDFETALSDNDLAGVQQAVDTMDLALEQISTARATVGSQQNAFEIANAVLVQSNIDTAVRRDGAIGVDAAESYLALTRAQTSLDAAVQIAAQLPAPGLLGR